MINEIDEDKVKEVLTRERGEEEALAPFFYKKVSLEPLEIDKEIVLKFRRSNFLDPKLLKEQFGEDNILEAFNSLDIDKVLSILSTFITTECRRELFAIKIIEIGNDGKEVEKSYTLEDRLKLVMPVDTKGVLEILDLLLSIHGYTKEQIEDLFRLTANEEKKPVGKSEKKKKGSVTRK